MRVCRYEHAATVCVCVCACVCAYAYASVFVGALVDFHILRGALAQWIHIRVCIDACIYIYIHTYIYMYIHI